jgi:tetratricopeptide (TPR) repeat protein
MVDWSYELLSPAEQSVLRSLSVFAGGFDLDAAESVCSSESVDEVEVANLLHSLVAKSLIVADKVATAVRFRLLETIRQFGAQELLRSGGEGEVFATRDRHAAYYVALAQISKQKMRGPEDRTWGPRLGQEMGNIRSALAHLANDPARAEDVLVIFTSLRDFLRVRDHADIIAFLRDAIEYFEGVSSPLVAEALFCAADLIGWHFSGDTTQLNLSWSLALRGLEMATQLNIPRLRALGLSDMAYHSYQLDFDGALLLLEEALLIADQSGDISLRFEVHLRANREAMGLARCRTIEGQIEEAHRILGFARQLGVTAFIGSAKVELAFHYEAQTNYEASERYYLESIALFEEIGADSFVHLQRGNLVYVLLPQGKFDESEQIVRQWLRKVRRGGLQIETSHIVLAAGCIAAWRGDYIRAARLLGAHSVQGPAGIARGLMIYTETDLQGESAFRDLVREVLGDEIFDREHSAGAFLTVSEATELALGRIVVL